MGLVLRLGGIGAQVEGGVNMGGERKKESSFSEEKEAKRLLFIGLVLSVESAV
jgi:hypothetical protein